MEEEQKKMALQVAQSASQISPKNGNNKANIQSKLFNIPKVFIKSDKYQD